MKKRKPKTAKALKAHTYIRGVQRFNICLDAEQQAEIVADIQANKCEFIERENRHRTTWRVVVQEQVLCVIYDCRYKSLVTILPQNHPTYCS